MGSIAPCHPLRSEAQADYETFLRGYQVGSLAARPFSRRSKFRPSDRRAFGEYLQPASNPCLSRPSRERHERDLRYRNFEFFQCVVRRGARPAR